ncbi:MAG TPA: phosphoadenylyl-sulfate reductase [Bacteroidales bacterium]|nr:phosphoadenylyl-sulfate reductase [Bacteroidales bacterium]HPS17892.1 phosphoadenylyl-sulfate reductase [Bacteroidales bacterium]
MNTEELNKKFAKAETQEVLKYFFNEYKNKIVFASSLGLEDQVITDMIVKINPNANIFTLDTGRIFPETYELLEKTNKHYNINIKIFFPDFTEVEKMVNKKGINLFYESVENRKLCCKIRKTQSLKRALTGMDAWICGLRREQSITRFATPLVEWDKENNLIKINPLYEWTEQQVWDYIKKNNVPYNTLHDKNFPSIGCQPCTRAINKGDDIRSGRWWWEEPENKECGLHKK